LCELKVPKFDIFIFLFLFSFIRLIKLSKRREDSEKEK